ncbi:MAG: chaperone modulator CbpM [Chitinophagaceae bacterium]|nr:chaperone modulator CbpM [Chitinophagaceae bacterium]
MHTSKELIPQEACCTQYNIEVSFIRQLSEYGLIDIVTVEEKSFIHGDQLNELEKFIRLHYDLDINMEGIDAIAHLLTKVRNLQSEVSHLKTRLQIFNADV